MDKRLTLWLALFAIAGFVGWDSYKTKIAMKNTANALLRTTLMTDRALRLASGGKEYIILTDDDGTTRPLRSARKGKH